MFRGSMVALVTPMRDGQVDTEKLCQLVDFHIQAGTHAIVAAGTTGESGTLNFKEKLLVLNMVIEHARERIPVIAGTGANATQDAVALTYAAMEAGAHAALIMTPAYIKPTQEGLFQHYSTIAHSVAMPIIMYNVPGRTACDLLPETIERLSHISNIVGIKEATGDFKRLQAIQEKCRGNLDIYSGDDLTAAQWMLAGAKGVISVTANVAARKMAKLAEFALDGDKGECLQLQEQLMPLHEIMFAESNPIPAKWALSKMGLISAEIRPPLLQLSSTLHQKMEDILRSLSLI